MAEWAPSQFNLTKAPKLQSTVKISPEPGLPSNFSRVAKWSPDGSTILSQCENQTFQLFDISSEPGGSAAPFPRSSGIFPQASPILDFIWFPTASSHDPASFCFIASVRECPVKLLDASDGRLRASYTIVDHRERQIAPYSLAFNLTAQRLYCGFEGAIEVFDVSQPGEGTRIYTTPYKRSKDGLKGVISSLSFSPTYGVNESYFAAGSFTPSESNIALFSDSQDEALMYLSGGPRAGVTQLQFNPMKPHILYASYRGSGTGLIYSWDIRSNVDVPLEVFQSSGSCNWKTNQKLRFDIDLAGRMLGVGDQAGNISIFQLDGTSTVNEDTMGEGHSNFTIRSPTLHFKANEDSIGSVNFHPYKPTLLSVAGSRHFTDPKEGRLTDDSDSESEDDTVSSIGKMKLERRTFRPQPVTFDSSINLWDFRMAELAP